MVQRKTEPQQSYDNIPLDLEDKIEGGDDEVCDREHDVGDVRGVRYVKGVREAVFDEEGLIPMSQLLEMRVMKVMIMRSLML